MATREEVRSYQRRLADLDTACQRAGRRLQAAQDKRVRVLELQDRLVDQARSEWQNAIRELARVFGVETTAVVLGLEGSEVARAVRATASAPDGASGK